jgi:hypothetical protein
MRGARETQEAHGGRRSRAAVGEAGGGRQCTEPEHTALDEMCTTWFEQHSHSPHRENSVKRRALFTLAR